MKKLTAIYISTFIILAGCAGSSFSVKERWEGIRGTTMRVYIRYMVPEEDSAKSGKNEKMEIDTALKKLALQRARYLLKGEELTRGKDKTPRRKPSQEKAEVIYKKCFEEFCEAYVDFSLQTSPKNAGKP